MYKIEACSRLIDSDYPNACAALLNMIESYSKSGDYDNYIVFFDGAVDGEFKVPENIRVDWSMRKTADSRIQDYIKKNYSKLLLSLVTSDTELFNFGRFNGVTMLTSGLFANIMKKRRAEKLGVKQQQEEEKPESTARKSLNLYKKLFDEAGDITMDDIYRLK